MGLQKEPAFGAPSGVGGWEKVPQAPPPSYAQKKFLGSLAIFALVGVQGGICAVIQVQNKFSTKHYLNLVLVDEEDRRYYKQQVCPCPKPWPTCSAALNSL